MAELRNPTSAPENRWRRLTPHVYTHTMTPLPPTRELVRAYRRSDAAYDGIFFVAVRTTGIFCRPTCPARKPLPKNVEYFPSPRDALASGYRPCKRCKPMTHDQQPAWVTTLLSRVDLSPTSRLTE